MRLKLTAMLVFVGLFFEGCGNTYNLTTVPRESHPWMETQYRTYHELLTEAKDDPAEIVTTDGRIRTGWLIRADADSIGWTNATDSTVHLLPSSRVQRLEITHHYHLWWLGSLVGGIGATAAAASGWEPEGTNHGLDYSGRTGVVLFGLGGALVGGLATGFIYHSDQFLNGTRRSADTTKPGPHD